jgi:hypothetical protein
MSKLLDVLTRMQAETKTAVSHAAIDDLDAVVPAALWREFVDAHAQALYDAAHPPEAETIALLRVWLERLDYSDPYLDKPKVEAFLNRLEPQGDR